MRANEVPEVDDGDVVVVSSRVVSTTVAEVSAYHVYLVWPWKTKDPESQFAWNGTVAFSRDAESSEWLNTPWRFEVDPSDLKTGDAVSLSIPEMEATVLSVNRYEPPRDAGWLPSPTLTLELCDTEFIDDPEAGFLLYCDTDEPISVVVAE